MFYAFQQMRFGLKEKAYSKQKILGEELQFFLTPHTINVFSLFERGAESYSLEVLKQGAFQPTVVQEGGKLFLKGAMPTESKYGFFRNYIPFFLESVHICSNLLEEDYVRRLNNSANYPLFANETNR